MNGYVNSAIMTNIMNQKTETQKEFDGIKKDNEEFEGSLNIMSEDLIIELNRNKDILTVTPKERKPTFKDFIIRLLKAIWKR